VFSLLRLNNSHQALLSARCVVFYVSVCVLNGWFAASDRKLLLLFPLDCVM